MELFLHNQNYSKDDTERFKKPINESTHKNETDHYLNFDVELSLLSQSNNLEVVNYEKLNYTKSAYQNETDTQYIMLGGEPLLAVTKFLKCKND